ncbi:Hypothetical predicted protein [Prunus dulcis]|uniref:Uncharacterized protein n=1 Tax=Prunus dulcis TaxID=3755 RepID=A0A5E4E4A7_PRUDU|nr:hypothetical protein L3X38_039360 [Prunus dulcis]VVA09799.1 Hypothetical predicted protein [Prunus dulcis]
MILLSVLLKPGVALDWLDKCVGHFHEVGLRGLRSRMRMKIVWRWMRRQKLRLIFNKEAVSGSGYDLVYRAQLQAAG